MNLQRVSDVARAAGRVRDAQHLSRFKHAVREFMRVLGEAPDEPGATTAEDLRSLQLIAEDVIDLIEERVADIEKAGEARELVAAVYEIRRLLEEAVRWQHHYHTLARPV